MNGCKSSCITLAAIAGASAAIAGGILAVSTASADGPRSATLAASTASIQADHLVADREALAVSSPAIPAGSVEKVAEPGMVSFEGTFDDMRHRMRLQYSRKLTLEFLAATDYPVEPSAGAQAQGPNPCAFCANNTGANTGDDYWETTYAFTGVHQTEDDNLPVGSNGSGLPEASPIDCTISGGTPDVGWRGKNDHCFPTGDTLFEDPNLHEDLPSFTGINQAVAFCGQTMNIDNTCHTGDTNGNSRDFDPDVWHYEIVGIPALDMQMTAFAEVEQIRMAMTYNFFDSTNNGTFGPITACSDGYGIFVTPVWQSFEISTSPGCGDGFWGESLQEGHWYILCFPRAPATGGPAPGTVSATTGQSYWYNVLLESIDPFGACCDTDTGVCTDNGGAGVAKSICLGGAGVFKGAGTLCSTSACCSPITDLGIATTPDWVENDQATYGSASELLCSTVGAPNINEIAFDFEGNLLNCETSPLTVPGNEFQPADICDAAGDGTFVIVGFSGTEDSFSSSFSADSFSQGDDDCFTFEIPGPDPVRIEALFNIPYSYVGYIVRDFGVDPLAPSCDVIGFLTTANGITGPCQLTRITQCLRAGVHGVYMQMFQTANVSCNVRYTITINCLMCVPGACCLKNGTCTDGASGPECEFTLHGNFQGNWSSCCASACDQPCDSGNDVNPPQTTVNPAIPDDDCTTYTVAGPSGPETLTGDLINSGCEAPDGNQAAYWSLAPGSNDRLWCANTGTYILDSGGVKDFIGDVDYYELDLSTEPDDTQVAITIQSQLPLTIYLARARARTECPSVGTDGTDDIRELPDTLSVGTGNVGGLQQTTLTACLAADQHIVLIETTVIVDCGFFYTMQLDYEANCEGACCITGVSCQNVAEDSSDTATAPPLCENLKGVYRGLGSRCPGTGEDGTGTSAQTNPLHRVTEITCCTIASVGGDVIDADSGTCATVVNNPASDPNGGCSQGTAAAFQSLGILNPLENGGGANGSTVVSVWGTTGTIKKLVPPSTNRDRDFYSFDVPAGPDAELLFFAQVTFVELLRLLDTNNLDPAGVCDINTQGLDSFTVNPGTCVDGGQNFGLSGLQTSGQSNCLDNGETHYVYIHPTGLPQCDNYYRFSLQLFECRLGACCLDNALCLGDNDIGFIECESILGGTFVAGASCPTGNLEGTLCLGVCCIDDDMNPATPVVCVTDTLYQECCITNVALDQLDPNAPGFSQGNFVGYQVGDNPATCTVNACVPSGACCVDSTQGFNCIDDQTPADCATAGGLYAGDDTLCSNSPCDVHLGACCVAGSCLDAKSDLECQALGGANAFQGEGTDCGSVACVAPGACCWQCPGNACTDSVADGPTCVGLGGTWAGPGTTCSVATCNSFACVGDLNNNGNTDVLDFGKFTAGFGGPALRCEGDLDCNGVKNVFDFGIFATNFGCVSDPSWTPPCPP